MGQKLEDEKDLQRKRLLILYDEKERDNSSRISKENYVPVDINYDEKVGNVGYGVGESVEDSKGVAIENDSARDALETKFYLEENWIDLAQLKMKDMSRREPSVVLQGVKTCDIHVTSLQMKILRMREVLSNSRGKNRVCSRKSRRTPVKCVSAAA